MNQARPEEEEKERKRDRKDRGQEADGKKGSPTKQNTSEELKQGLPRHRLRLTKKEGSGYKENLKRNNALVPSTAK